MAEAMTITTTLTWREDRLYVGAVCVGRIFQWHRDGPWIAWLSAYPDGDRVESDGLYTSTKDALEAKAKEALQS